MDLGVYEIECIDCRSKFGLPSEFSSNRGEVKRVRIKRILRIPDAVELYKQCLEEERKAGRYAGEIKQDIDLMIDMIKQLPAINIRKGAGIIELFVNKDNAEIEDAEFTIGKKIVQGKRIELKHLYTGDNPVVMEIEALDVEVEDMVADVEVEENKIIVKCPECGRVCITWEMP